MFLQGHWAKVIFHTGAIGSHHTSQRNMRLNVLSRSETPLVVDCEIR